jgi:glucose 1-dehydrogenase
MRSQAEGSSARPSPQRTFEMQLIAAATRRHDVTAARLMPEADSDLTKGGSTMLLRGRKAIVTGAASGIGRATAERLGREGASVCVNYYSQKEREPAERVVASIEQAGAAAIAFQADVSKEEDVKAMVARAATEFRGLDLLVNNAGIEKKVPLLRMSLANWDAVLTTNLTGSFLCLREAARVMARRRGGVIVNISSVHDADDADLLFGELAGGGLHQELDAAFARAVVGEAGPGDELAPGAIATPINRFVLDDPEAKHAIEEEIPLGRIGKPSEIAAAVVWVASEQGKLRHRHHDRCRRRHVPLPQVRLITVRAWTPPSR